LGKSAAFENPRGIFDRSVKGVEIASVPVQIERGRIRESKNGMEERLDRATNGTFALALHINSLRRE